MFSAPVAATAIGLAKSAALAGANALMLVSGFSGREEQCESGRLQEVGGHCVGVAGSKLVLNDCHGNVMGDHGRQPTKAGTHLFGSVWVSCWGHRLRRGQFAKRRQVLSSGGAGSRSTSGARSAQFGGASC